MYCGNWIKHNKYKHKKKKKKEGSEIWGWESTGEKKRERKRIEKREKQRKEKELDKISLKGKIYDLMCINVLFSFDFIFCWRLGFWRIFFFGFDWWINLNIMS